MKRLISLAVLVAMFASTSVFAEDVEKGWNSPECVFTAEADEPELREFAIQTIVPHIDKNRAMTFESYSFKDMLIAIQMVVCEGKTPQEAVNFVDPE